MYIIIIKINLQSFKHINHYLEVQNKKKLFCDKVYPRPGQESTKYAFMTLNIDHKVGKRKNGESSIGKFRKDEWVR